MPVTLDYIIHKDSVDFIQIVDSSHIQTLAQIFPQFVINPIASPVNNDSLSFVSYRNTDSTLELGATLWADGDGTIGLRNIGKVRQLGWIISYKKDSSGENYTPETGFVVDFLEVKYDEGMPPMDVEEERFYFSFQNSGNPQVTSSITHSGAKEKAIFYVNDELKKGFEEIGRAAFGRTQKIMSDHKNGQWLK